MIYLSDFVLTNNTMYLEAQTKFLALFIMQFSKKSIRILQLAGFVMMLCLMVILNHRIEKVIPDSKQRTEKVSISGTNNTGIAPLTAQIPHNTEGALPIKLISNPNSPFLAFINKSFEYKNKYRYTQNRKQFLTYCSRLHLFFITEFMVTVRNKDIL